MRTTLPASRCAARPVPACKPVCMLPSAAATGTAFPCRKALPRWPITLTKPGMTLLMWASGTWPLTGCRGSAPTARPRRYRKRSRASTATGGQRMCWNSPATATTATSLTVTATSWTLPATGLTVSTTLPWNTWRADGRQTNPSSYLSASWSPTTKTTTIITRAIKRPSINTRTILCPRTSPS